MTLQDPLVGRVVDDTWRIERRLAARGVGAAYEVCHVRDGGYHVLEVLLAGRPASDDAFERFGATVERVRRLRHPNVVSVRHVGRLPDGAAYVVMDYLEGETVAARLDRDGTLPWPDARRVLDGAVEALSALHGAGVVHGQLEPASIFLMRSPGRPEKPLLMHFGITELATDDGRSAMRDTGAYPRQSAYESPERLQREPLDARTDVYSLAAILFEMVTGAPPFPGPNAPAVLARVLTEETPEVSAYAKQPTPAGLHEIMKSALAKEPADRLPDVETFRKKIQSLEALHSWAWPSGVDLTAPVRRASLPAEPTGGDDLTPVGALPAAFRVGRPPRIVAIAIALGLVIVAIGALVAAL